MSIQDQWARLAKSNEAVETLLKGPKDRLYPVVFGRDRGTGRYEMKAEVRTALLDTVRGFLALAAPNPEQWSRLWVIGSGISWNWNTGGDLDIQAWIDPAKCPVDLLTVRAAVDQTKGLELRDVIGEGAMYLQVFAKAGTGTTEENLAQQPYACYDLDNGTWAVYPVPQTAEMYGHRILMAEPEARGLAAQAQMAMATYQQAVNDLDYWSRLAEGRPEFHQRKMMAQVDHDNAVEVLEATYDDIVKPRQKAYKQHGRGLDDQRDTIVKVLEMWGIFEPIKHAVQDIRASRAKIGEG